MVADGDATMRHDDDAKSHFKKTIQDGGGGWMISTTRQFYSRCTVHKSNGTAQTHNDDDGINRSSVVLLPFPSFISILNEQL